MNIYSSLECDEFLEDLRKWCIENPSAADEYKTRTGVKPVYTPILFGEDNGFYGKKHTPEQIKI